MIFSALASAKDSALSVRCFCPSVWLHCCRLFVFSWAFRCRIRSRSFWIVRSWSRRRLVYPALLRATGFARAVGSPDPQRRASRSRFARCYGSILGCCSALFVVCFPNFVLGSPIDVLGLGVLHTFRSRLFRYGAEMPRRLRLCSKGGQTPVFPSQVS